MAVAWSVRFRQARFAFFRFRFEADLAHKVALIFGFAGVTGLCAQLRIALPFTPIPITFQTFAVLASGVYLGHRWGALAQVAYVLGGLLVPWYAGFGGGAVAVRQWAGLSAGRDGLSVLLGATAGFLIAFPIGAGLVGWLCDRRVAFRTFPSQFGIMVFASAVVLAGGSLYAMAAGFARPEQVLSGWILPFLPGDIAKAELAALVATATLPKTAFDGEADRGAFVRRDWEEPPNRTPWKAAIAGALLLALVSGFWGFLLLLPPSSDPAAVFPTLYPVTVVIAAATLLAGFLLSRSLSLR